MFSTEDMLRDIADTIEGYLDGTAQDSALQEIVDDIREMIEEEEEPQKMVYFPVTLVGYGRNADEAWEDACEGFEENHGPTPDTYTVEAVDGA